ncbi:MAG: hypothetical protein JNL83_31535 [Myxococcales bacterium]|nr:hypothetical protein [Myxococcales bacterium]
MRIATTLFVFLAACTSPDATSRAVDVAYESDGSGLASSNVQDALDDLVAMARASEDKIEEMQTQKRSAIECRFQTANLSLQGGTSTATPHVFTALECGGALPDATYTGAISKFETCSAFFYGVSVMTAGEPDGPGIVFRSGSTCNGPAKLVAVFHKVR